MKRSLFKRYEVIFVIGCLLLFQMCCQEQLEEAKGDKAAITESKPALAEVKPQNPTTTTVAVSQNQESAVSQNTQTANKDGPELTFENLIYDFGEVGAVTKNDCELKFKNTGTALLKITNVHAPCGCTVTNLDKKEYEPGESGVLSVA